MANDIEKVGDFVADQVPVKKIFDGVNECGSIDINDLKLSSISNCALLSSKVGNNIDATKQTKKTHDVLKDLNKKRKIQ